VQDHDGDENYNVWAVDPAAAPAEGGKDAPAARNLTDAKGGARPSSTRSRSSDPDTIFVGLNDRDAAWHDVYKVKISTGERTLVARTPSASPAGCSTSKDQLRLAVRISDKGDTEVLRVDPDGFTKVYSCSVFESCGPVRFHKDGKRVYMETNKGDAGPRRAWCSSTRDRQGGARRVRPEGASTSATPSSRT
jgi:hypothetical protein